MVRNASAKILRNLSRAEKKGNSAKSHIVETGRVRLISLDLRKYRRNPY